MRFFIVYYAGQTLQPQSEALVIRGLGAEPTNKQCAKCKHFALLATIIPNSCLWISFSLQIGEKGFENLE